MNRMNTNAISQYRNVYAHSGADDPGGYHVVQMLLGGALERIAAASGHMHSKEVAAKGECISRAIDIITALRGALDHKVDAELTSRLDALYEYMMHRLFIANVDNDPELLEEVSELLRSLKSSWDEIPAQARQPLAGIAAPRPAASL